MVEGRPSQHSFRVGVPHAHVNDRARKPADGSETGRIYQVFGWVMEMGGAQCRPRELSARARPCPHQWGSESQA